MGRETKGERLRTCSRLLIEVGECKANKRVG